MWRISGDIGVKWKIIFFDGRPTFKGSYGILNMINDNAFLSNYAGLDRWNDIDMLVVGLYGKNLLSGVLDGIKCTNIEYQTQISMWCMMASPLTASNDIRSMDETTKRILLNKEVIAINQSSLGRQAELKIKNEPCYVFIKTTINW